MGLRTFNSPTKRPVPSKKPGPREPHSICQHCGRKMNDFKGGYSRGPNNELLCHPNEPNRPDCYRLVTIYNHASPCALTVCYEDHPDFLAYAVTYR